MNKNEPKIKILFAPTPESPDLRFVEVENESGASISVGEWTFDDKHHILTLPDPRSIAPLRQALENLTMEVRRLHVSDSGMEAKEMQREAEKALGWVPIGNAPLQEMDVYVIDADKLYHVAARDMNEAMKVWNESLTDSEDLEDGVKINKVPRGKWPEDYHDSRDGSESEAKPFSDLMARTTKAAVLPIKRT